MYTQEALFTPDKSMGMTKEQAEEASRYSPAMVYTYWDVFSNDGCSEDNQFVPAPGKIRSLVKKEK